MSSVSQPPVSEMDFATYNSAVDHNVQPFFGVVDNTVHAFRLILAAQKGLVPRIVRRPSDTERREMIISGAVFIFGVEESGIKRWRDGLLWSASRIEGNFLVSSTFHYVPSKICRDFLNRQHIVGLQRDGRDRWGSSTP